MRHTSLVLSPLHAPLPEKQAAPRVLSASSIISITNLQRQGNRGVHSTDDGTLIPYAFKCVQVFRPALNEILQEFEKLLLHKEK